MKKKGKANVQQSPRLTPTDLEYLWIPVTQLERNDSIVMADQEYRVQNVEQKDGEWLVSLVNPETRLKAEQFYNAHDYVYVKATSALKERLTKV